jgi:hypothetical protein
MSRSTRSGAIFSPYDLIIKNILASVPPEQIIRTGISLAGPLEDALASDILYADKLDEDGADDVQWEDESDVDETESHGEGAHIDDVPSSPPSPAHSRSHSPSTEPNTSTPGPDPDSPSDSRHCRQAKAKKLRRQERRQKAAASSTPFDYKPGKANDQSYRSLPPKSIDFDAASFKFSGGGSWIGAREWVKQTKQQKNHSKGWGSRRRFKKIRQLRKLEELLAEGCKYVKWDGECVFLN